MPGNEVVVDVIEALAEADGLEPTELDYNLSDYMDPDVIEKLDALDDGRWELTFRVSDHQVTINHEDQIIVNGVNYAVDSARRE